MPRPDPAPAEFLGGASRPAVACAGVVFGLIAGWMGWITETFLTGQGWYDRVVGEVVLAAGLFAALLLIWAISPRPGSPAS